MAERDNDYIDDPAAVADRACARCQHFRRGDALGPENMCERPQLGVTHNPVMGYDVPNSVDAYADRASTEPDACGPSGKYWTPSGFCSVS